jgi:hypothetical protein
MKLPQLVRPVLRTTTGVQVITIAQHANLSDACVTLTVNNGKVCLNVPVVGSVCIPVPSFIPSGTAVSACIDVCTKWYVPTGACVTVTALGQQVARECFGAC